MAVNSNGSDSAIEKAL